MKKETAIVFIATFIGLFASVIAFNFLVTNHILPKRNEKFTKLEVKPEVAAAETSTIEKPPLVLPETPASKLQTVVEKELVGSTGNYAVAIKNLKTGESYFRNEHTKFESASLYKLWVMAATFEQIKTGKLKESDVLTDDIEDLNKQFNIASESAERRDGNITLSVAAALKQMITISHNYAALLLTSKIKLTTLAAFLKENGFDESNVGQPPKTTAYDTLEFFEKLYKGVLSDPKDSEKMLELLKQQQLNHKLPKYLPAETVIAHKTGELNGVSHDAGIVYTNKGEYIIVILSESKYPKGAEERIADISKAVYSYYSYN